MFTHGRQSVDLNGKWKFCPDPMQRCRRQKWWANSPDKNRVFPCWEPEGLWDIKVPGTWKTLIPELKWYDGHAVYMKDFKLDVDLTDKEVFLAFDGVVYESEIYLNGRLVTKHEWGYSPFQVRITDMVSRDNRLFVLVDNHLKEDRVPGGIFDWNNDGGIINPVKLVIVPKTYIENFRTQTILSGDKVEISFDVALESRDTASAEEVTVSIPELNLSSSINVKAGQSKSLGFKFMRKDISLWSPESPKLYEVELSTRSEVIRDRIGFREIKTVGRDIVLNGEPVCLYGVCVHSEFKDTGRTSTPEGIEMMVKAAKDLGLNFLRCAHYPYSEAFGRAMDEAGLMWWEEVPAYWLPNMHEEGQTEKALGMLNEMIHRDWNRAGIIIWSVSNECCWRDPENHSVNNYPYWFKAAELVRELDPSRLVSCAESGNMISLSPIWDPTAGDMFDRNIDEADMWTPGHPDEWYKLWDVLAANIYTTKEEAETAYKRYVKMFSGYNKPMMLSEFGSMSLRGADCPDDQLGSEKFHSDVIDEAYRIFKELDALKGFCPWCLTDIRVPIHWRWYNTGSGVFRYGFMDENWIKKEPYYTLKNCIAELKESRRKSD